MTAAPGRRAVFLDRDGTLIVDRHYLADPAGVELLPGAGRALARLNAAGFLAVLVTNQSGIGRGYFTEARYRAVHRRLCEALEAEGARLDAEYHCPLGPDDPDPGECRKPRTGMYRRAAAEHGIDLSASFYVGDRLRDVLPALPFGGVPLLLRSPETEVEEAAGRGLALYETMEEVAEVILGPPHAER